MNNDYDIIKYESMISNVNALFELIKDGKTIEFIDHLSNIDMNEININTKDDNYNSLIFFAVMLNNPSATKKIISYGGFIDILDPNGYSILYYPIRFNYVQIIDILLDYDKTLTGVSLVNIRDKFGNTPLHYAVKYNNINILTKVLNNNAEIIYKNNSGFDPLHTAIINKKLDTITLMLKYLKKINNKTDNDDSYLHLACNYQLQECVQLLLSKNINSFDVNNIGFHPIFYSVIQNDIDIIKIFTKIGFNLYHQDLIYGNTLLHYAIMYDRLEIIDHILSVSTIKNKNDDNFTENINSQNNNKLNIIDPDIINIEGLSLLHLLMYNFNEVYVKYINKILPYANLNYQDNNGYTVLHVMVEKNIWQIFEPMLRTKKLNIFILNANNQTVFDLVPLIYKEQFLDMITYSYSNSLIKYGESLGEPWQVKCSKINPYTDKYCSNKIKNDIVVNNNSVPQKIDKFKVTLDLDAEIQISTFIGNHLDVISGVKYLTNKYDNLTSLYCDQNINQEYYMYDEFKEDPQMVIFNLEIRWIYQKIFYPQNFQECFLKIIGTKKYKWIVIPLGIILSKGNHSNILLFNVDNNTLERFEPHGSSYPFEFNYNPHLLDDTLFRHIGNILYNHDDTIKLKYVSPKDYLPKIGFQTFENTEAIFNTNIGDPNGFCTMWCFWYIDYRLKYENNDPKKIVKKLMTNIRLHNYSFRNIIRNYSKKITDLRDDYLNKIGKNINDYINKKLTINDRTKLKELIINI